MKLIIITFFVVAFSLLQEPEIMTITGEQTKSIADTNTSLVCKTLKLSHSAKITKAEGNCAGYWIQKGNITIHNFKKPERSIGTVLKPGSYTVYPELKPRQTKASITITLEEI
ncbi:MAG: hypothetical protein C0595_14960 [Marinilabiliales bacterium]|nr:MAG: hypothetical protein C0595_14960 [Marinilabiliales bacterium]